MQLYNKHLACRDKQLRQLCIPFIIELDMLDYNDRPNQAPEACGVMVYWDYNSGDEDYTGPTVSTTDENSLNIINKCIRGHVGCFNNDNFGASTLGTYETCDDISINSPVIADKYRMDVDQVWFDKVSQSTNMGAIPDFEGRDEMVLFDSSKQILTRGMGLNNDGYDYDYDFDYDDEFEDENEDKNRIRREYSNNVSIKDERENDTILPSTWMDKWYCIAFVVVATILLTLSFYNWYRRRVLENWKWKSRNTSQDVLIPTHVSMTSMGNYGSC